MLDQIVTPPRRVAIIDLGSNTARLVLMRTVPGYAYRLEDEIREVVRLRQGMTTDGLSRDAMTRAFSTLRLFKRFCDSTGADHIVPTATSAVRVAANGPGFVARVQQELGLDLNVLDGEREAYYGTIGALNEVPVKDGVVVDLGGGSMQISEVRDRRFRRGASLPLGALTLTEGFVTTDPIDGDELKTLRRYITTQLQSIDWLSTVKGLSLIGQGGTVRNLARMATERVDYPLSSLHGYRFSRQDLQEDIRQLIQQPLSQRKKISGLNSDRADIILPGALVFDALLEELQIDDLTISHNGLREGLFFEHFWEHLTYPVVDDVRRFTVINLARNYFYQKNHAGHVRYLAGRLFDQLAPLHGYGPEEGELLEAAALLHDLGTVISYYGHHKHSQTLIINAGLPGFAPRETALIALLTRYHRKGTPSSREFDAVLKKGDEERLQKLAAILRLAEFLERGRNATVDDVTAAWTADSLRLTLLADEYPAVELWEAERNAVDLVAQAFGRTVTIESSAAPESWT